jgi:hypothetical protein
VNLIDCSNAQGSINWVAVKNAGVQGAWLKATEGVTFNDSWYATNRRRANVIGLRTGAYHFARPENNSAVAEADHFSHVIGKPGRRDLKPVLDMEGKGDEAWAHDDLLLLLGLDQGTQLQDPGRERPLARQLRRPPPYRYGSEALEAVRGPPVHGQGNRPWRPRRLR